MEKTIKTRIWGLVPFVFSSWQPRTCKPGNEIDRQGHRLILPVNGMQPDLWIGIGLQYAGASMYSQMILNVLVLPYF